MNRLFATITLSSLFLLSACSTSNNTIKELSHFDDITTEQYQCGKEIAKVTFANKDNNSIAVLSINHNPSVLLANAISASGARYVGDIYEIWTKGDEMSLTNYLTNPNKSIQCQKII